MLRYTFTLIFLPLLLVSGCTKSHNAGIEQKLDAYLQPYVQNLDFSGAVLLAKDGEILVSKGYGRADHSFEIENYPNTVFHAASLTKQFTATAILKLHQAQKIDLQAPVSTYTDVYPFGDRVTVHQLLSQRSGIPDYNDLPDYEELSKQESTLEEVIRWVGNYDIAFEPGSRYGYSNSNYVLLAHLIERISGIGYEQFMQKEIFGPAGMTQTGNYSRTEIVKNRAEGYDPAPGGLMNAPWYDMSFKLGSGSVFTTVEDLYRWDRMLNTDEILNSDSRIKLFTDYGNNYGYGWGVYETDEGNTFASHDGKSPGSFAYIKRYFEGEDMTIIFLSNINSGALNKMKRDLTSIMRGGDYEPPAIRQPVDLKNNDLSGYTGIYDFPPRFYFEIIEKPDGLYFKWMDTPFLQYLTPVDESTFIMRSRYDILTFVKNDQGQITEVHYDQGGGATICPKRGA